MVNVIKPEAEKLKYWNKNKDKQMKYQTSPVTKPGPERSLSVTEEFVICLVSLRIGLIGLKTSSLYIFMSQAQVSRYQPPGFAFLHLYLSSSLLQEVSKHKDNH